MKVLAWALGILSTIFNIDAVWKIIESITQVGSSLLPFGSLITFVFIQQRFPDDKKLKTLSQITMITFVVASIAVIWDRFLR